MPYRIRITETRAIDIDIDAPDKDEALEAVQNLYLANRLDALLEENVIEFRTEDGTGDTEAYTLEEIEESNPEPEYLEEVSNWLGERIQNAMGDEVDRYEVLREPDNLQALAARLRKRNLDNAVLNELSRDDELWNGFTSIRDGIIQDEAEALLESLGITGPLDFKGDLKEFIEYDYDPDCWQLFRDEATGTVVAVQEGADCDWDWTSYDEYGDEDDGGQFDGTLEELLEDISLTYAMRNIRKLDLKPLAID